MLYIKGDLEGATAAYSKAIQQRGAPPARESVRSPEQDVALLLGGLGDRLAERLRPAPRVKPHLTFGSAREGEPQRERVAFSAAEEMTKDLAEGEG
jgi:hypothetical protein